MKGMFFGAECQKNVIGSCRLRAGLSVRSVVVSSDVNVAFSLRKSNRF